MTPWIIGAVAVVGAAAVVAGVVIKKRRKQNFNICVL